MPILHGESLGLILSYLKKLLLILNQSLRWTLEQHLPQGPTTTAACPLCPHLPLAKVVFCH